MKRYKHILSHYNLLTCDMGELVPVNFTEVLPGDTIQGYSSIFMRLTPQLAPVMHPVECVIYHFNVPYRILDSNWEEFITGGKDGLNSYVLPTITTTVAKGDPLDYLGIPPGANREVLAYPIRAMNKIFNEWFRDQDLVPERAEDDTSLPKIAWRDDYFVQSRPFTQKGPQVTIPIGGSAPVTRVSNAPYWTAHIQNSDTPGNANPATIQAGGVFQEGTNPLSMDPRGGLIADLASATGVDVRDLRSALGIQRYQENRARYGSRFTEFLRYLGIRSSDARLQRPEMLGGGRAMVMFSEVLNTAADASQSTPTLDPLGRMGGHGIAALRNRPYRRFFEEHGCIISLMSVRPTGMYTQGIHKSWLRKTKEDFWQRELEHIGQEAIHGKEIWADSTVNEWGYTDRYKSYSRLPNRISGDFRDTLDFHHLGRVFAAEPVLNEDFVTCNPSKRIFAEQTEDALWCMVKNGQVARRLLTNRPTPRIY